MKKLSLDIDQLDVESFESGDAPMDKGTVFAHITDRCTGPNCDTGDNCSLGCGTLIQACQTQWGTCTC